MEKAPFYSLYIQFLRRGESATTTKITLIDNQNYLVEHSMRRGGRPVPLAKRQISWSRIAEFRDRCQEIGVFSWSGTYDKDVKDSDIMRWSFRLVFEENVFSIEAQGKSEVPSGFDELLEELYKLDLPRPQSKSSSDSDYGEGSLNDISSAPLFGKLSDGGHMSLADMSAYASVDDRTKNVSNIFGQIAASGQGGAFGDALSAFKGQDMDKDEIMSQCKEYYRSLSSFERDRLVQQMSELMGIEADELRRMLDDFDEE